MEIETLIEDMRRRAGQNVKLGYKVKFLVEDDIIFWDGTEHPPVIEPKAIDKFQDILVQGNVLEPGKRVKFTDLVLTEFASKAK